MPVFPAKKTVNTEIEIIFDVIASLDSHKQELHIINRATSIDREYNSCVSGRFIQNTTSSKSNSWNIIAEHSPNLQDWMVNANE